MNLADKTVLNILAKSSEAFLLLISSVVMVRALPKAEYGTFLQVMLIANTMLMFALLGLPQSIFYFFQQAVNQRNFIIRNAVFSLCIGFIASIITFSFKNALAQWLNNPLLLEYGWIAPLLILFRAPSRFREPMLISHGSLIINSAATLLSNITFYSPVIIAALFSVSLDGLLKIMIMASGVELCLFLGLIGWLIFHAHNSDLSGPTRDVPQKEVSIKDQVKYALPIGVSSYIVVIGRQLDQYIVSLFFTPGDFALYSRGAMRIPVLSTIRNVVNEIMKPKYIKAYRAGDIKTFLSNFHLCIEKVAKVNFVVFSFLLAVAPSIITLLYTKEYVDASPIFRVYLCLLLTDIAGYTVIFSSSGKTSYIMHSTVLFISSNIVLSLSGVSIMGPIGAAIATVISRFITIFYNLFRSSKILKISFYEIFPWKFLSQLLVTSLIASLPVYCIEYSFHLKGGNLFLALLVNAGVYFYCCVFLMMRKRLIYQDDIELLKKWLRFDVERFLQKITFSS